MANAKERLTVFENIIARVGLDGDVIGEYAKALSAINGMQTMSEIAPPPIMPPQGQNMANTPQLGQSGEIMPPMADNGLNMP